MDANPLKLGIAVVVGCCNLCSVIYLMPTMYTKTVKLCILWWTICCSLSVSAGVKSEIIGYVKSVDGEPVGYATVYLKGTTNGCATDENGAYRLSVADGKYIIVASALGYKTYERSVTLSGGRNINVDIVLEPDAEMVEEVIITARGGVSKVNKSAFNAVAIDTRDLRTSTKTLSEALARTPGMKLRESGGVGSDMQLLMDGFSGKHVKIFIDGVPQEGVGSSLSLNNIPVGFAERIEVYKGVVPVGFATDAIGGVINIVTKKNRSGWLVDASYSYGSFNTHKSHVNFSKTFANGLMFELNAFQNYSDNSYWIDTPVELFLEDGSTSLDNSQVERVRRFHDTYHNEAVIGKFGVLNKSWADRLVFSVTYSQMYKEIQNGVIQKVVFGEKARTARSIMPSLEYSKRDLLTKGLDVMLTATYNDNLTRNIDTASYRYNWFGDRKYMNGQLGEQSYQDMQSYNDNWNATATVRYRLGRAHVFTLNHVMNNFRRTNNSLTGATGSTTEADAIPKLTRKNITGLSYQFTPSERWNVSVFGKYYNQYNSGPVSTSESGTDNYEAISNAVSVMGYGAAGTVYLVKGLQTKLSYEKAYRMPTNEELFGDEDLELGQIGLRPEKSHNLNLSFSYNRTFAFRHGVYAEVGLVYRNTTDYIQRLIGTYSGNKTYASYVNHGKVLTKGINVSARYTYNGWVSVGGNFTRMDVRDNVKTLAGGGANPSYGARVPNQPYMFASADVSFYWNDLFAEGNRLTVTYDNLYMHSFPRYSENLGSASTKEMVPTQFSHNIMVSYSVANGKYNFSVECVNLTDAKLYDNFSLQKAGRAFYGKVSVMFSGSGEGRRHHRHEHDGWRGNRGVYKQ